VPSVERVLSSAPLQPLLADYGRTRVLNAVRAELERWRSDARTDPAAAEPLDEARIAAAVARTLAAQRERGAAGVQSDRHRAAHEPRRALLPDDAVRAVVDALTQPVNLESRDRPSRRPRRPDRRCCAS
jgi:L-seryl-tRNA(Ser) seleniumtransferase